jgi:hypothetical protein
LLADLFAAGDGSLDYAALWRTLSAIGLVTAIGFAALFRDETAAARAAAPAELRGEAVGR